MKEIKGRVEELIISPGRDNAILVRLDDGQPPYVLMAGGTIMWNDYASSIPLILANHIFESTEVHVTLHPRADRYDASTDAEFVSNEKVKT